MAYVPAIVFAGGTVVPATRFDDDFALDPKAVEAATTPRTKASSGRPGESHGRRSRR